MLDIRDAKKQIVLTLTNNSSRNNSTIDLLGMGNSGLSSGAGASSILQSIGVNSGDFAGANNWTLRYYNYGDNVNLQTYVIPDPTGITDLVSKLNAEFGDIFWFSSDSIFTFSLRVASSLYDFFSLTKSPLPVAFFTDSTSNFISGSTVQVSVGYGVSYNALVTDLTNQPYLITSMYVSSSSQSQTTQQIITQVKSANGVSKEKPINPIVDPNQSQNVQMAIPVYMPTSALNKLRYTVLAGQSATVIVRYEHVDLVDALELMKSGDFQKEMRLLREQDAKEYARIMETVKGFDVVKEVEGISINETKQDFKPIFAVPLIYSVARQNGNFFVEIL